ncbi:hypothetical protein C1645_872157 [Glomus cerebriforme]|uniref:Uncharacterized protein n=1 Tax=Glomus cerebriforme TaxID=658196 RepID=A0A397TEC6_9GLOM|nr:hypothetical protein C1645_872157 [Glomus cerebriforme]
MKDLLELLYEWIISYMFILFFIGFGGSTLGLIIFSSIYCWFGNGSSDPFCNGKPLDAKSLLAKGMFAAFLYTFYSFIAVIVLFSFGNHIIKNLKADNLPKEIVNHNNGQDTNSHETIELHSLDSEVTNSKEIGEIKDKKDKQIAESCSEDNNLEEIEEIREESSKKGQQIIEQ